MAKLVNVASVPMRSPFRYPGGKTWFVPLLRRWIDSRPPVQELIEPFAGGAVVSLTAVAEGLVGKATLVELDTDIAAVWSTILNGHGRWLADEITCFNLTAESVDRILMSKLQTEHDRAFATIIKNRVNRGGILAAGASRMKEGENGKGLASRWYPETLRKRILHITGMKKSLKFINGDGIEYMRNNAHRADVAFFIDPPYTVAGRRLYTHSEINHAELFEVASTLCGDFIMTYDNAPEIKALAKKYKFSTREVPMKNTHHEQKMELVIGRDLKWVQ